MRTKRNLKMWVVMSVFLVGMAPAIAAGEVIYVDADASPGGDGSSWGTAYKYLQDALYKPPTSGDEIWVAEGTYKPDVNSANPGGTGNRGATFGLKNGVALYGGFAGGETNLDERNWQTNETILSGDIGTAADNSDNSCHVVVGASNARLDGFAVTGGNAGGSNTRGGGMDVDSKTNLVVANCTFSSNSADCGGGISNWVSSLRIDNCTFRGNSAGNRGGGMRNWNSSPTITNCTFSGNSASEGGGMFNNNFSSPKITNCTFTGNSAGYGGGFCSWYSNPSVPPRITNCIFWGNSAPSGPEIALRHTDFPSRLTISYSDVEGGQASVYVSSGCSLNWGAGNINADPLFVGPPDNLRLLTGSPCIDAGDNTAVPGGVTTDLDGNPRFVDDPLTADTGYGTPPIVDMGAYEYQPLAPSIIYVDADASGANNGTSWEDAFEYLQDALTVAYFYLEVNEIWVAEGTYKPDANTANPEGTGEQTATFQLINGVALYGGYAGVNEPDPNERDWRTNETILSGDLDGNDVQGLDPCDLLDEPTRGENSYHVVTGSGTTGTAVLDGFTITAGNARYMGDDLYPYDCGGGMYNNSGSPTVVNCTFTRNSAVDVGGGMSNYNSGPTVMNCMFSGNSAAYDGGGMDNENSSPMVSNCAFIGNLATGDSWGGGMCNANKSSPTVTNCTFSGNTAYYGGGMYNDTHNGDGSNPTLTNCILWGNTAPTGPQIYTEAGSSPTVSYSNVQGSWPGTENIDEDPLFIGSDGLDGIPGTADDEESNVHLRGYSPCINAGDPSGNYTGQVDIDRQPRVAYGRVDMGADEVFPAAGDFEPDGDVDFVDFAIFANHWLLGIE